MSNLTVVIITKNEEHNIADAVKNAFNVASKVVVVDSGSTDKTIELAKGNGALVVTRQWDNNFAAQRNFGDQHVETEWVLHLDADERISEELASDIKKALENSKEAIYKFVRRNSAFGREFKHGVLAPDTVLRMYPLNKASWVEKVHERPVGNLPIIKLSGYLQHFVYTDFSQYLNKMNLYSTIGAQNNKDKGKKSSVVRDIILRPFGAFLKMYLLKGGILEGWLGFVLCLTYANYTLNKYVKLKFLK